MRIFASVMLAWMLPVLAAAQADEDTNRGTVRIGPLTLTPAIAVKNVGIDSNVFYEPVDPKRDFTATVAPSTELTMKAGAVRAVGSAAADFIYFEHYASERALNTNTALRVEVPWNRFTPYVAASMIDARERPGLEIDLRARRRENTVRAGGELRVGAATTVVIQARRSRIVFDGNQLFLDQPLGEALNRHSDAVAASFHQDLTPLTRMVVELESARERFDASPLRDSDTLRVAPGLELGALALISGHGSIGYRRVTFHASDVPAYRGLVGDVALSHTLLGMTQLSLTAHRDVLFSVHVARPYYLETALGGSITQHLIGAWDLVARLNRARLDYRALRSVASGQDQADQVTTVGAGLGYRTGGAMRVGVDVDRSRRRSGVSSGDYEAMRMTTSVTYGF